MCWTLVVEIHRRIERGSVLKTQHRVTEHYTCSHMIRSLGITCLLSLKVLFPWFRLLYLFRVVYLSLEAYANSFLLHILLLFYDSCPDFPPLPSSN